MEAPAPTSPAAYWRRDLDRHGLALSSRADRLWRLRPARGWASVVIAAATLLGTVASALLLANPTSWLGVPTAILAMFVWGPILITLLVGLHVIRVITVTRAIGQSDEDFTAACAAKGSSIQVSRAVRRALAKSYGVPVAIITSADTGWTLSRFMESPCCAELATALADRLGREGSAEAIHATLREVKARSSVADLCASLSRARA